MPAPVIWTPSAELVESATLTRFARACERTDYAELWRWSVDDPGEFWTAIWRFFEVGDGNPGPALSGSLTMPGTSWFPEGRLNYAEQLFGRGRPDTAVALHHASELTGLESWTWGRLREATRLIRGGLQRAGVEPGDRVAALLPNVPDTVAAFLAAASLGAIWTLAAPEFGADAIVDRFQQLDPVVLLAADGYRYGGRDHDRWAVAEDVAARTGAHLVRFGHLDGVGWPAEFLVDEPLTFVDVAFDHPLWVVYSSGTTGLPKAIVHGHGGMVLEQLKSAHLHLDARTGDRVFWFTTTGWMMWNYLVGVLFTEAEVVLYDGSPAGDRLWDLCWQAEVTIFGTSAAFITSSQQNGARPREGRDLRIRAVGSTGSTLNAEGFTWLQEELGASTWIFSMSGGTDVCTAFVGGVPILPVHLGELQAPALGAKVEAWDPDGRPVPPGEMGDLVLTVPLPSMPLMLWGDPDGARLAEAYFDVYPGVWRHGDWITLTDTGGAVIHGRSDATINRGGVRIGTSEIYRAVLNLDEVNDALVVDLQDEMVLFLVLREPAHLDAELRIRLAAAIRQRCSPRHVPDSVHSVPSVPRTRSGKLLEIPVKRLLLGADVRDVLDAGTLADAASLGPFLELAAARHAAIPAPGT